MKQNSPIKIDKNNIQKSITKSPEKSPQKEKTKSVAFFGLPKETKVLKQQKSKESI